MGVFSGERHAFRPDCFGKFGVDQCFDLGPVAFKAAYGEAPRSEDYSLGEPAAVLCQRHCLAVGLVGDADNRGVLFATAESSEEEAAAAGQVEDVVKVSVADAAYALDYGRLVLADLQFCDAGVNYRPVLKEALVAEEFSSKGR